VPTGSNRQCHCVYLAYIADLQIEKSLDIFLRYIIFAFIDIIVANEMHESETGSICK
jgi:hypothetical protein